MANVNFWKGNQSDYNSLEKDENILYFVMDTFKIFLGTIEMTNNNTTEISVYESDIADSENSAVWH